MTRPPAMRHFVFLYVVEEHITHKGTDKTKEGMTRPPTMRPFVFLYVVEEHITHKGTDITKEGMTRPPTMRHFVFFYVVEGRMGGKLFVGLYLLQYCLMLIR